MIDNIKPKSKQKVKLAPKEIINIDIEPQVKNIITEKDIYNQFIIESIPFRIYINGLLLFDSKNKLKKDFPVFKENEFILYNKNYIYRGITIERY